VREEFVDVTTGTTALHRSQFKPGFTPMDEPLYVVTVITNPVRFRSRLELYHAFEKRVSDAGAILYTVEVALGDRPFEVTSPGNPRHLRLRTNSEIWHKENALNLGIQRLPDDWKYVAWIDADVHFARPDWAQETIQQLQHYSFVQLFSHAQDLGPNNEPLTAFRSFAFSSRLGLPMKDPYSYYSGLDWHPGYAWAARREALDSVGGLIDRAVLGSADRHMAAALIGKVDSSYHPDVSPKYKRMLHLWQNRALQYTRRNLGVVEGLVLHHWHGKKVNRGYSDRWKLIHRNNYDPEVDLKRDSQGLFQLNPDNWRLRDDIRSYFRSRSEDSIDV
jgi:hypothetical protein